VSSTEFSVGTRIVTGLGSLDTLSAHLAALAETRVVVVADRGLLASGTLDTVYAAAKALDPSRTILVDPDPSLTDAERAALEALAWDSNAVVAVGGGSALCAAKAVAIRLTNPAPLSDYEGVGKLPNCPAPTIAIPTTAGSGSEVSNALVLHEEGRPREIIIRGSGYEPTVAILDANLLSGLPRVPMLYAALDALSHAMEALWARRRTAFTDSLAESSVETILRDLPRALDARQPGVLQRVLDASSAANLACGNSGLALVHALSCAPTIALPHGYQNGALLLAVGHFNRDSMDWQHQSYLKDIETMFKSIDFAGRFAPGELGADASDAMLAASTMHPFRLNNARESSDRDIVAILAAAGVPPSPTY